MNKLERLEEKAAVQSAYVKRLVRQASEDLVSLANRLEQSPRLSSAANELGAISGSLVSLARYQQETETLYAVVQYLRQKGA